MTSPPSHHYPQAILNIPQDDLKERYRQRVDRIKRYCTTVKRIGSTTHLQVRLLTEQAVYNGTPMITIQVEAYPLESLAKATQFLVEALCEAKCWAKYTIPDAHKANDEISIEKQRSIQAEGEYCPPLTMGALKRHDLQTSCELHQFRCPTCLRWWWKTVPEFKPVCKCRICKICLNPLKPLERFGVGRFVCRPCGNVFFCRCEASDSRRCDNCGRVVHKPYIRPFFKIEDTKQLPEQQYPYESANAPSSHGSSRYPSYSFSGHFSYHSMNTNMNDPPYRRGRNFLRNYFPPEFYVGDSRYSAASNPPHAANPASMRPPFATGGLCPTLGASTCIIYPSSAVSLQNNSSIGIGSTLCSANSHAVSPMVQSPAAINHPFGSYEPLQGPPRFPQSLVLGSSAPICPSDFSTTPSISGETTTAVSSRNVLPDPGYVPSETRVISSSNRTLQLVGEHNYCFPQPLLTTSVAAVPSSSSSGDAISVPCEAAVIPLSSSSTCMSPTSASGNSLQGSQQPPSSTNGQFPTFPSALDVSDSEPAVCSNTYSAQPKLNSYCSSVSKSLDNALADLHLTEASCAQPHPQSESPDNAPVTLISSLQPAAPTSTSINPPLAGAETTAEATANSITGTGILVKATHVSPETQPSNVDYNPPETTAIPSPEPQSDLTASKHLEFGANAVSLAAATKSDPSLVSLTESGAPTTLKTTTSEANSTVHLSSSQMVANSTLNPPQGANNTLPPISSSLPHPSQQITTVSTPQAMATKLEPKAEPSTIPPLSFNIPPIHGNSAAGAAAGPMPGMHPPHQVRNDQWTSYQHNRIRIPHRMNPRDLKYKQVSTRHKCSGSTIGADIVPQLNDHFRNTKLKLHEVHHQVSSLGNQRESESPEFDLGYDMMEVSSEEEEEGED